MSGREPRRRGVFESPPEHGSVRLPYRLDGAAPDATAPLLLCLHGQGQNEDFFAGLLRGLHDLPWNLVSLRAPFAVAATDGAGFSWYDYDGDQERFRAELRRTDALLRAAVEAIETGLGLRPRRRFLLGFSQGGYCGSYVALMNPAIFAGMVISGARVKTEILEAAMRSAAAAGFRALLCHGARDASVTREAAESSLEGLLAAGVDVALQVFDSGHAIGRGQVAAIRQWLVDAAA